MTNSFDRDEIFRHRILAIACVIAQRSPIKRTISLFGEKYQATFEGQYCGNSAMPSLRVSRQFSTI